MSETAPPPKARQEYKIGQRLPMPPKPTLKVFPVRFLADHPAKGPRGIFTNGRGGSR